VLTGEQSLTAAAADFRLLRRPWLRILRFDASSAAARDSGRRSMFLGRLIMKKWFTGIGSLIAVAPALSLAQQASPTTTSYIGAGVGRSHDSADACLPLLECETHDTALKAYAGSRVNDIVGLELSYVDFGQVHRNDGTARAVGADLSLILNAPISQWFSVFAKGGGMYAWTHTDSNLAVPTGADRGSNWGFGGGLTASFTPNWALRGDWERHRIPFVTGTEQVDLWTAGVRYRF
jgi:opacity protein-like surface antigen